MSKHTSTQKWRVAPAAAKPAYFAEMPLGWKTLLWILPFFLFVVFSADTGIAGANIVLALTCIGLTFTVGRHMDTGLLNGQALSLFLYVLLGGISCFYARFHALALQEFVKLFLAFSIYLLFLILSGHGKNAGRNAASALSVSAALFSFLSIDLVSTRWFSGLFRTLTSLFTASYTQNNGLEVGTRITSVLEDPNVFAGVAGIGVLLALGLAVSSRGRERVLHLICLAVSALGFLLVFSLGATGFILAAFAAYLIFLPGDSRANALLVMIETLLVTAVSVFLCYTSVFDGTKTFSLIPLLCMVAGSAVLCLLDRFVGARLESRLGAHQKTVLKILVGLVILAVVYLAAGMHVTGSIRLAPGESLDRAAYLSAGSYTAATKSSAAAEVTVTSQNAEQLIMHTSTKLYSGDAQKAAFSVPKTAKVVWFSFRMKQGGTLNSCTYAGKESGSLKLGYKLLPGFVANRLQGLRTNQNAIQRVEFWNDSLKIWKQSPIFGRGLGALEGGLFSVATFYYQTKYAHNHYIQLLTDLGVVGLLIFLSALFFSIRLLVRARKRENRSPLLPCLSASLVFMILQAIIQVDFSSHSFLPFAFGVFALINLCSTSVEMPMADAIEASHAPLNLKKVQKSSLLCYGTMVFALIWAILFSAHLLGTSTAKDNSQEFFGRMQSAMQIDPFNSYSYKISYISGSRKTKDKQVKAQAGKYAKALIDQPSNFDPAYAAEYFFEQKDYPQAFAALKNHLEFNRARTAAWTYAFELLAANDSDSASFRSGAKEIAQAYRSWQKQSLGKVKLSKDARTYLATVE